MTSYTSVASGNWSNSNTWSPSGIPTNGDTVTIAAGHVVDYDAVINGTGVALNIYGTLRCTRTPGSYYLKLSANANMYSNSKIEFGTFDNPLPSNVTITVDCNTNYYIYRSSSPTTVEMAGVDPATAYVQLAQAASAGATRIYITKDVRGDLYWEPGAQLALVDVYSTNRETKTISAVGENYIDLSSGLSSSKSSEAVVVLCKRNVSVINGGLTQFGELHNIDNVYLKNVYMSSTRFSVWNTSNTNCIIQGGIFYNGPIDGKISVSNSVFFGNSIFAPAYADIQNIVSIGLGDGIMYTSGYVSIKNSSFINGGINSIYILNAPYIENCVFKNCAYPVIYQCNHAYIDGCEFINCGSIFRFSSGIIIKNSEFNLTSEIAFVCDRLKFINCVSNKDIISSANRSLLPPNAYIEAINHNQVEGAYIAITRGGTVENSTSPLGDGSSGWYKLSPVSTTDYCFLEKQYTVQPSERVSLSATIVPSGVTEAPKLVLLDINNDPLIWPSASYLAETSAGTESGKSYTCCISWTNITGMPRTVRARIMCRGSSGQYVYARWKRAPQIITLGGE